MVLLAVVVLPAHAQPVSDYLSDEADTALRIQVELPDEAKPPEQTWWQKLTSLLGVRKVERYKPPIGTSFIVSSSAYAPSPYQTDSTPCITAAGTKVRQGVVASNFLPIGTILEINKELYMVEDRMNSRYAGYFVDIWFPSTSSALQFGRQKLVATVVGYGKAGDPLVAASPTPHPHEAVLKGNQAIAQAPADQGVPNVEFPLSGIEEDNEVWSSVKDNFSFFSKLIPARNPKNVDQYDVDCFAEPK